MFLISLFAILIPEVLLELFARATQESIVGPFLAHFIMGGMGIYALYEILAGWGLFPFRNWYNRVEEERRTREAKDLE